MLDAFENFEGLIDRRSFAAKIEEFRFWVEISTILGIEIIQVPASFEPATVATGDEKQIIFDLQTLADIGLSVVPAINVSQFICSSTSLISDIP